jgi:hypothetical protein
MSGRYRVVAGVNDRVTHGRREIVVKPGLYSEQEFQAAVRDAVEEAVAEHFHSLIAHETAKEIIRREPPERITEAELTVVDTLTANERADETCVLQVDFTRRLVRDVRRLRGLIERAWPYDGPGGLAFSNPRYMDAIEAAKTLHAEAEAIRKERG